MQNGVAPIEPESKTASILIAYLRETPKNRLVHFLGNPGARVGHRYLNIVFSPPNHQSYRPAIRSELNCVA